MPDGSCLCGACTVSHTGETQLKALCHCLDCRKISGSTYSTNLLVPIAALHLVSGAPRQYTKDTDAGNRMTSYFCGECGTTLWRESSGYPDIKFLKEGVLDHVSEGVPATEFFAENRVAWVPDMKGAAQSGKSD